jgi:uncharacterized membrane protein
MNSKIRKEELIKKIIKNDENIDLNNEQIMHRIISETVSKDINKIHDKKLKFRDKMSDKLADFAGSWTFIIIFMFIMSLWIIVNIYFFEHPFDPYPFILLNLVLSCLSAFQAPIIMMSQNRQEKKDRFKATNDYTVNLKSEMIVEDLHYKLDTLIETQQEILGRLSQLEEGKSIKQKNES